MGLCLKIWKHMGNENENTYINSHNKDFVGLIIANFFYIIAHKVQK